MATAKGGSRPPAAEPPQQPAQPQARPAGEIKTAIERQSDIKGLFASNMSALVKAAPRTAGDPTRLIRIAYNAIWYDPKLRQCSHRSLLAGVLESIKLGLAIGGPMQEAWLIPFNTKQPDGGYGLEATFIVGFQGYRALIDRARAAVDLQPHAVYEHDLFDCEMSEPRVTHKPWWMVGAAEPGRLTAAYVLAHLRGGGKQLVVLSAQEIEQHRQRSRAKDFGPWVTDYEAMALKTVVRVAAKYLPKQSEAMAQIARALELDDHADRGEPQWQQFDPAEIGARVFDESATAKPKSLDALKSAMGQSGAPADAIQQAPPASGAGPAQPVPGAAPSAPSPSPTRDSEPESDTVLGLFEGDS